MTDYATKERQELLREISGLSENQKKDEEINKQLEELLKITRPEN